MTHQDLADGIAALAKTASMAELKHVRRNLKTLQKHTARPTGRKPGSTPGCRVSCQTADLLPQIELI